MSKKDKLRRKIRNNPKNVSKQDLETLLGQFGFMLDRVKGSHYTFIYQKDGKEIQIVIPMHGQKVKPAYVKLVTELLDAVFPESEANDDN